MIRVTRVVFALIYLSNCCVRLLPIERRVLFNAILRVSLLLLPTESIFRVAIVSDLFPWPSIVEFGKVEGREILLGITKTDKV